MMQQAPHPFTCSLDRAASSYDHYSILQGILETRLLDRLSTVKQTPERIVHIGARTGNGTQAIKKRYPKAQVIGVEQSHCMLQHAKKKSPFFKRPAWVQATPERLPFQTSSIDFVIITHTFHQLKTPHTLLNEVWRILQPGGGVFFMAAGPNTLQELRHCALALSSPLLLPEQLDMHDLGDALIECTFQDPVVDMQLLQLTYSSLKTLWQDLKKTGENMPYHPKRDPSLHGRHFYHRINDYYHAHFQNDEGQLIASFESILGLAWVPVEKPIQQKKTLHEVHVPLQALRTQLQQKK